MGRHAIVRIFVFNKWSFSPAGFVLLSLRPKQKLNTGIYPLCCFPGWESVLFLGSNLSRIHFLAPENNKKFSAHYDFLATLRFFKTLHKFSVIFLFLPGSRNATGLAGINCFVN